MAESKDSAEGPDAGTPGPAPSVGPREPLAANFGGHRDLAKTTCGCHSEGGEPMLVYALGKLGCHVANPARLYSFAQRIGKKAATAEELRDFDRQELVDYLGKNARPWEAEAVEWTLEREGIPIYALRPQGPFAANAYAEFLRILASQRQSEKDKPTEWVAVPGHTAGTTDRTSGPAIPVIVPDLRGICDWTVESLLDAARGRLEGDVKADEAIAQNEDRWRELLADFLERVYNGSRNLGLSPEERAINYAATDAYQAGKAILKAIEAQGVHVELDRVQVRRNPLSHPQAACCDIELYFSQPKLRSQALQRVYRYMVDVSDAIPVTVGEIRSWSV
jgi:cyanobactin maturation PatA/PatG family protease